MSDSDFAACAESMPESMQRLPVYGGLPVPWWVGWRDDKPDFGAPMPEGKRVRALRQQVCVICGGRLRRPAAFFDGAVMGIMRAAADPPAHIDCAGWTLRNCRVIIFERPADWQQTCPPSPVKILWLTRVWTYSYSQRENYFDLGPPTAVEWYCAGRSATRAEAATALDAAMLELRQRLDEWPGGLGDLVRRRTSFEKWLPGK